MNLSEKKNLPFVSVIVPMYNEEKYIQKCLTSLIEQDYPPHRYELLFIDGLSTDNSPQIIKEAVKKYKNIRILKNLQKRTSNALNIGIAEALGEIIVRMDAHAIAPNDYISVCVHYLLSTDAQNVGGIINTVGEGFWGKTIALATSCSFGVGNSKFRYSKKEGYDQAGWPGSFWKNTLKQLGCYDELLGCNEDDDLNFRIMKSGLKVFRTPKIIITYFGRSSLKKLWNQYFIYGFWKVKVIQKFGKLTSLRHLIPSLFVLSLILFGLLSIMFFLFIYVLAIVLGMYFILAVVFSFKESMKPGLKYIFSLPIVFLILHLSYGIGFILGIIRFVFINNR